MSRSPMNLEVWSDIACPWCWVGKRNLALALTRFEHDVDVTWRAFELNPRASSASPKSVDYVEKLAAKYRSSRQQAQAFIDRMVAAGVEAGIEFRFDRILPSNTFNAHRLLAWSREFGLQDELKERLFLGYMNQGLAMSDQSNLCMMAADVGLDSNEADILLSSDRLADAVHNDKNRAAKLGISGVPFFLLEGRIGLSGAQPPEVLVDALMHARDLTAGAEQSPQEDSAAASCSADGCAD